MFDEYTFITEIKELQKENDPCLIEFYINKTFQDLKDGVGDACDDGCCCGYGLFTGGSATSEYEELMKRNKENLRKENIRRVLDELIKFYTAYKPELVPAVKAEREKYV